MKKKIFMILGIMILFVPLGLLTSNPAWGEWDSSYYKKVLGFIPNGVIKMEHIFDFKHVLQDYSIHGANDVLGYYVSAIVGVILIFALFYLLTIFNKKKAV